MKKKALKVLLMASLWIMLAGVSVYAGSDIAIRANIPFDFVAGNKTYPAGTYAVEYTDPQGVFVFQIGEDERRRIVLWSNTVPAKSGQDSSPKLLFNRYGDQYFLAQVWTGGDIDGRELPKTPRERKLAMEYLANNVSVPEVVSIAALLSVPMESAVGLTEQTADPIQADRS